MPGTKSLKAVLESLAECCSLDELQAILDRKKPASPAEWTARINSDLDTIVVEIEGDRERFLKADEDAIRNEIARALRQLGYDATADDFYNGHVDLKIKNAHLKLIWMGEAKFANDYDYLAEGMKQLLTRYSAGRHNEAALIVFVRQEKTALVKDRWMKALVDAKVCDIIGTPENDPDRPLVFWSKHEHQDSGLTINTRHIMVSLHYDPKDQSGVETAKNAAKRAAATAKKAAS